MSVHIEIDLVAKANNILRHNSDEIIDDSRIFSWKTLACLNKFMQMDAKS